MKSYVGYHNKWDGLLQNNLGLCKISVAISQIRATINEGFPKRLQETKKT